jgi:hypothetical protein
MYPKTLGTLVGVERATNVKYVVEMKVTTKTPL